MNRIGTALRATVAAAAVGLAFGGMVLATTPPEPQWPSCPECMAVPVGYNNAPDGDVVSSEALLRPCSRLGHEQPTP